MLESLSNLKIVMQEIKEGGIKLATLPIKTLRTRKNN